MARGFRFRAQAALELRVREHEATLRELARAETEQQHAAAHLAHAEQELDEARRTADDAVSTASGASRAEWYRFWILRLDHERAASARALAACDAAVAEARAISLDARRKRESLERFREKSLAAFVAAEAAAERKTIDELATRRFAVRAHG